MSEIKDGPGPKERLMQALKEVSLVDLGIKCGISPNILSQIKGGKCAVSENRALYILGIIEKGVEDPHARVKKPETDLIIKMELKILEHKESIEELEQALKTIRKVTKY